MRPIAAREDARFGSAALELAPRSLPIPTDAQRGSSIVRVALHADGLEPELRGALERGACTLEACGRELELTCSADMLQALATDHPGAAALFAAHRAARRPLDAPRLCGVLNVTPDSFSDGGRYLDPERAVARGRTLFDEGADLIDVGGESTRPGASPVPADEELARILPVIEALAASLPVPISVDTTKAEVARRALDAGARMVNDVSAGMADGDMLPLVAERDVDYVAMHMRGTPRDMQRAPWYEDPVAEILEYLRRRVAACIEAGLRVERVLVDPGMGFGKRVEDNLAILRRLGELRSLGLPLYVGVSRKSFIGRLAGEVDPFANVGARVGGSAAAVTACVLGGASVLRVHDVAAMREAVQVALALRNGEVGP